MPIIPSRLPKRVQENASQSLIWNETDLWIPTLQKRPGSQERDYINQKVAGKRLGTLGVHLTTNEREEGKTYVVTALTVGRKIVWCLTEEIATQVAEHLWQCCSEELKIAHPGDMVRALPRWVVPWCLDIREKKQWFDPKNYE